MAQLLMMIWVYTLCFFSVVSLLAVGSSSSSANTAPTQQLTSGFKVSVNPKVSSFQPLITDSDGNYSLGFLRVSQNQLNLAVIHAASSETIWLANMTQLPRWSDHAQLTFNGGLAVSDSGSSAVFWSTPVTNGAHVYLSNDSNLQIQASDGSVLWQSFDFPSDTLVENQNFTSDMALVSSNGIYSMRLGSNFMGLYAILKSGTNPGQIYFKNKALQAKVSIIPGRPIYLVLKSDGFLGMYQNGTLPADIQPFYSYQQPVTGVRLLRMESDGNLNGYFWNGSNWILDYQAVRDTCQLPSSCGPYGLCQSGKGCSCLNNQSQSDFGRCVSPGNHNLVDFCSVYGSKYKPLRYDGVDLPYKELMDYQQTKNYQQCESACQQNCKCWGIVYNNASGFCYIIDYPIQSLVTVSDESKMGFFKVSEGVGKSKMDIGLGFGVGVAVLAVVAFGGLVGFAWYRYRKDGTRRGVSGYVKEDGVSGVGPYKDLGTASFRSIELSAEG